MHCRHYGIHKGVRLRKSTPDGAAPQLPFQLHSAGFWARTLVFLKSQAQGTGDKGRLMAQISLTALLAC